MYGKLFSSAFTGSMLGAGADVFAVWAYVIAATIDSRVELNPRLLAAIIGMTEDRVNTAIEYLCAPDSRSRNKDMEGRRLIREGEFQFFVTGHTIYRKLRNEDERREYNRVKQAESRAKRAVKQNVNDSQRQSAMSAQAEAKANREAEAEELSATSCFGELPKDKNWCGKPGVFVGDGINLETLDWGSAVRYAEAAAKKVKVSPATETERRQWFQYGAMAAAMFGEGWIVGAATGVANSVDGTKKTKQAHFVSILKATAKEGFGIDNAAFLRIRRSIKVPYDVFKSETLGGPKKKAG